ncbi:MAG: arylsulfatase [Chloroflexi bacterium]|nr:arylsulfatase [Chloroflexota bacterium]MCI0782725.1 arylsulfatase [Chloroflexota bacterium]MCI0817637.1 arylsulfatase [Chloroflexota bacterium]MCI0819985.1 arylsulfatase [Chloroflexota bacterium]MCI0832145.1 arylsulfatase [Chloroflexota bacterium]
MSGSEPLFEGKIGRTLADSEPWWPAPPRPPGDAPNIVMIVLDDTGFAHFGCFGSTIETPNIDRLAANGVRYSNFHTTALCSPSRACLLTGRNHHAVGMRGVSNFDTGFPHMRGGITPRAATVAELLRTAGYATYSVGKWHLAPMIECSAAGPHDNWPLQKGFDRFYGFLQGETDQFYPELTADNHHIVPPAGPGDGYHVSEDMIDQSIQMIRDLKSVRPDRPFFLHVAFGATHAPHQSPQEYREKYRGRFDEGWDKTREAWFARQKELGVVPQGTTLSERNPGVLAWDELPENEQKFAARLQEAFAGFLEHTDAQIGRLVAYLESQDLLEDTLLMVLSDNGASQEGGPHGVMDEWSFFNLISEDIDEIVANRLDDIGGPHSHSNIPWGWSQVGNTPLRWYKQNTYGGGIRDPLVIHWPKRIKQTGGVRDQFCHVTDLTPTILDVTGVELPDELNGHKQIPLHGESIAYTWDEPDQPTRRRVQYFEQFGHRGLWKDGWKAVTYHGKGTDFDTEEWSLYNLAEDFSECHDLAKEHPEKLKELVDAWWVEAEANGVLPLDDRSWELFGAAPRPGTPHFVDEYVYTPPISHIPADACPALGGRSWSIVCEVEVPKGGCEGVLYARGGHGVGHTFFVKDGKLQFDYNALGRHHRAVGDAKLAPGAHRLEARFDRGQPSGTLTIAVDGTDVGSVEVSPVVRMLGSTGMDLGQNPLSPVVDDYEPPFAFTGRLEKVTFRLRSARQAADVAAKARADLATE